MLLLVLVVVVVAAMPVPSRRRWRVGVGGERGEEVQGGRGHGSLAHARGCEWDEAAGVVVLAGGGGRGMGCG